jgi:hypothetical protein
MNNDDDLGLGAPDLDEARRTLGPARVERAIRRARARAIARQVAGPLPSLQAALDVDLELDGDEVGP